jgi:hypothetical protein
VGAVPWFSRKTAGLSGQKGICRTLVCSAYRQHRPIEQRVIVRCRKGLPRHGDECWFLMSDLSRSAFQLSELHAPRMTIEEFFRDGKSRRNGFAPRNTLIKHAERFDRLLLILVLAYLLIVGLGQVGRRQFRPGARCSTRRQRECSDFTIGQRMLAKMQVFPDQAVTALTQQLFNTMPNWG